MTSNSEKSEKLMFRKLSPTMTKEQLQVLIEESLSDGVGGKLTRLTITSVGITALAFATFDSVATAEAVLGILHESPLGPDFSPVEVRFSIMNTSKAKQPSTVKKERTEVDKVGHRLESGRSSDVEKMTASSHGRTPSPSGPGTLTSEKPLLSFKEMNVKVDHKQKSKQKQFVDIPDADVSHSAAKAKELRNPRKGRNKPKAKSTESLVLKVNKIDSAVDSDTFDRYLKMKNIKFINIEFKTSDVDDTSEATVYFTCEKEVRSALESMQKQCAIGIDGSEAEVTIETLDQPYQTGAEDNGQHSTSKAAVTKNPKKSEVKIETRGQPYQADPDGIPNKPKSKKQQLVDMPGAEDNGQHSTLKAAATKKPKKGKSKAKSKSSGSFVLKVKQIDSAVDIDTFDRYLKMKNIKFVNIEFTISDDVSNEATVYFSCEKSVLSARDTLQKQCAIGADGSEAEVTIEEIGQPYQVDPEQGSNPDPQAYSVSKSNPEQGRKGKTRGRKKKLTDDVIPPGHQPGMPRGKQQYPVEQPNQGYRYQMPPPPNMHQPFDQPYYDYSQRQPPNPNMPPGQHQPYMNTQPPSHGFGGPPPNYQAGGFGSHHPSQEYGFGGPPHGQKHGFGGPPHNKEHGYGGPPHGQERGFSGPPHGQERGFGGPPHGQERGFRGPPHSQEHGFDGHRGQAGGFHHRAGHPPQNDNYRGPPPSNYGNRPPNYEIPPLMGQPANKNYGGRPFNQNPHEPTESNQHNERYQRPMQQHQMDQYQPHRGRTSSPASGAFPDSQDGIRGSKKTVNANQNKSGSQPKQKGKEKQRPSSGQQGEKPSAARPKQPRGRLPMEIDTPEDKMSRMFDSMQLVDDNQTFKDQEKYSPDAGLDNDDNDSVVSDMSSASQSYSQTSSHARSKPSSQSLLVSGFDSTTTQSSFAGFLRARRVNFIHINFRGASGPSAVVKFRNTRETTNGKRAIHNVIMQSENGSQQRLRASYIWPQNPNDSAGRGRGPMKAMPRNNAARPSANDNRSDVGSSVSSRSRSNQQPQSTILKITGLPHGIDPALVSNFIQDRLTVKKYDFKTDENQKMYSVLYFDSPRNCSQARSKVFGQPLAQGGNNVNATYLSEDPARIREPTAMRGGANVGAGKGFPGRRSGSSGSASRLPSHQPHQTKAYPASTPILTKQPDAAGKQQCCLKVTAIDESIDEEAFLRFLRRKRIRINNFQWLASTGSQVTNRANLHFLNQTEATAAMNRINGCLLGEIALKAELSSTTNTKKPIRRRRRPKQKNVDKDAEEDDYDDASSDVSSVASYKGNMRHDRRQRELRRQERLATSIHIRNIDPKVDEDDFRGFLLEMLEDFTELQFFQAKKGNVAVVKLETQDEAKVAKESINGKVLGNTNKRLHVSISGGSPVTKRKEEGTTAANETPVALAEQRQKQIPQPHSEKAQATQLRGNPNDVIIDDIPRFVRESDMATLISESSCSGFINLVIKQDETASSERSAILTFDSRVTAVEATAALYGKRLKGFCMNVRLAQEHSASGLGSLIAKKKIRSLLDDIETEGNKVTSELESKINDLALEVREIEEKLEECDSIAEAIVLEQQKEVLQQQIGEIQGYQLEFEQVSAVTKNKLDQLQPLASQTVDLTKLDDLRQRFLRECRRNHKPLPIYGHKAYILETITASDTNACVIRAETGSGKSTQVPQYLIEDSDFLANSDGSWKTVICTQPRRVAAISLARRVAEEYGCKVGEEVGYVAGQTRKKSSRTLLTFMTDRALLNICLADKSDLKDYACVLIDEAHERSVDTDILLAMLKQIQERRSDLKIVIMSATIDVDLFSNYLYNCPVIDVPGRTFPVDTIWCGSVDTTGSGDYINKAVQKAVEIHKRDRDDIRGDILVFMTSQNEIERACNQLATALKITNWQETKNENVIILPLHGKLQPDDQMKVFKDTPEGKRKIVFATNVAETSVTIPGIKYVVDTGMVKECQYDPQRNMSLLKVTNITQASAEQRKGRAGRTGPGICYRLYSKTDYDEMEQSMKPEILRVHLGMAMLQLTQMGVQDVENFDFVESPEKGAIQQAMMSLVLLGGVDDQRQLTSLGKSMAQLPLEPRLAKLVLTGIGNNLGDEAVTIAALISAPGNIMYRGSSEADQKTSEMMKLKYSSEGGDILTALNIYKKWLAVPEKERNAWCRHNSMNAKTLRSVKENANEITLVLKKSLQIVIEKGDPPEDGNTDNELLRKILMSVYFENLSIYNGHARAGYTIVGQQKTAVIHPSSVLKSMQSQPKWLIYGDLRRTTKDFICELTPVEAEWIDQVVPQLFREKIDREALEQNIIKELKIENVGTALMKTLAMKRFERLRGLEDAITKETNTPCIIEADWEGGNLNVFIAGRGEAYARQKISGYLEDEKTRARRDQIEVPVGSRGSIRHVVVTGGETGFVLMGDEFRSLDISNISTNASQEEVLQLCRCQHDLVKDVFKFPSHWSQAKKGVWGRVTFLNPSDAAQAKTALEETIYPGEEEQISAQPSLPKQDTIGPRRRPVIECAVEVTWFLTRSRGFGFVSCDTTADSLTLIDNVQGLPLKGKPIKCNLKKEDTRGVFISHLDYHLTQEELENALKRATRVAFNSVSIARNKSSPATMKNSTVRKHLHRLFNIEGIGRLEINILDPRSEKSQRRKAFVNFDPSFQHQMIEKVTELQTEPEYTDTQEIYHVRMLVTSNLYCSERMYGILKDQIDEFIDSAEGAGEGITVKVMQLKNRSDRRLQISGNDYQKVLDIRTAMNSLLHGEEIPVEDFVGEGKPEQLVQRSLHNLSQGRLQEFIGDTTTAFIDIDMRRRIIHLYGKQEDRDEFKILLHDYFFSLTETKMKEMHGIKGPVLRALVLQFGPWLEQLKEEPGVEDVTIDTKRGVLMITGSEDAQDAIFDQIKECIKGISKMENVTEKIECGICFCPAETGEKTYRLLSCGHYFCLKCLENLLQYNMKDKTFPVICPRGDCTEPLMIVDIRTIFPDEDRQTKLFRAALEAFVTQKSKQNELKFCPHPDCCMIYRQTKDGTPWTCAECGHQICSSCGQDPHPGNMTCAEYRISKQSSDAIWEWARKSGSNVKQCPTPDCGVIEKFEGCNHVTCPQCKKHICWKCLAIFDASDECYSHLSTAHSGCFDY